MVVVRVFVLLVCNVILDAADLDSSWPDKVPGEPKIEAVWDEKCAIRITGSGMKWEGKANACYSPELRGEPGSRGQPRLKGDPGERGEVGLRGEPGEQGPEGPVGPPGIEGLKGMSGIPGLMGQKGLPGHRGPPGEPGQKGETGSTIPGPPGLPGAQGVAPGPMDQCKGEYYYLNPIDKFFAKCDIKRNTVCVNFPTTTQWHKVCEEGAPCWLLQSNLNMDELYGNDMYVNIEYLSKFPALQYNTQTINIECKYVSIENMGILLLHSLKIGLEATDRTSIHYEVNYNSCNKDIESGEAELQVTLAGPFLPITDFHIAESAKNSELSIKISEVCFYNKV